MKWIPRFLWDDGSPRDETLSLPIGLFRRSNPIEGGDIESDAGHPASYVVRRTYCVTIPIRYYEEEWPIVRSLIEHGQGGGEIMWFPDESQPEFFVVYLESPALGEEVRPAPDGEYPQTLSILLTLRKIDDSKWDDLFFFEED